MNREMYKRKASLGIVGLDLIVVVIFAVAGIAKLFETTTFFQQLIIGIVIGLVFSAMLMIPIFGTILQAVASFFWTVIIYALVPYKNWVNESQAWIYGITIAIFIILFIAHKATIKDIGSSDTITVEE